MDDRSGPKAQETAPEGQEVAPVGATHRCRRERCSAYWRICGGAQYFMSARQKCQVQIGCDLEPLAATAAGQEVPSGKPPTHKCRRCGALWRYFVPDFQPPGCAHSIDSLEPIPPRSALPEEVVCEIEKTPHAGRHMDGLYPCVDPRPAHPPSSPSGTSHATPAEPEKLGEVEALRAENARLRGSVAQFDTIVEHLIVQLRDAAKNLDGYLPGYARDYRAQADGFTVARRVALPPAASPTSHSAPSAGPSTVATKGDK